MSRAARWMGMGIAALALALAHAGCGEILDIDTIEPSGSDGAGASPTASSSQGGGGGTGGAAGGGGQGGSLPATVEGRGCVAADVCGPDDVSCCESRLVEGEALGEFRMGCSYVPGRPCFTSVEGPEHIATIGNVYLDTFEATVGRFRQFEEEYEDWRNAGNPAPGAGAHPRIPDSGWQAQWTEELPIVGGSFTSTLNLDCEGFHSWENTSPQDLPQNCVIWPMAFAFCIWSGGRLPTEAEWEMAATGGDENRLFPWGNIEPTQDLAIFNWTEEYPPTSFLLEAAGSRPLGMGRFGHHDLSGNLYEQTLDQYSETWFQKGAGGNPCNDCANLGNVTDNHTNRGGAWYWDDDDLTATNRLDLWGLAPSQYTGVRCVRDGAP